MPIKLLIPHPNEAKGNVKDLVFSILSQEHPLTLSRIFDSIKSKYSVSVTYQGVRKAVDSLVKEDVLLKKGKIYEINREWITHAKNYLQNLERSYFLQPKTTFKTLTSGKDYKEYRVSSLYELDLFWSDIIINWSEEREKAEEKVIAAKIGHLWWMLINLGNETKLNKSLIKKGINFYMVSWKDSQLDKWALNINKNIGIRTKVIREKPKEYVDTNVIGNLIIQVRYPEKIIRKLESFYRKYNSVDDMNSLQISNICHEETEIYFKFFKDSIIAQTLRRDIINKFE